MPDSPVGRTRRIKEMLPEDIVAALAADPRLLVPVGACEQHGPHLPLGGDTMIVERAADELSAEFGLLRAPTLEYGVNMPTKRPFAGTASLRRKTLHRALNDLLDCWESAGVREFVLLTAHDHDPHLEALATVSTSGARVLVINLFDIDLSDVLEDDTEAIHGGEADTSLLLFLAPDVVRMELARDYTMATREHRRYRKGWLRVPEASSGSIGRPTLASAEKGRLVYARIYGRLRDRLLATPADG